MAYIVGLLSKAEAAVLEQRGWELEEPPKKLFPPKKYIKDGEVFKMVFVDADMFDIMSGPDWEQSREGEDECPAKKNPK